MVIFLDVDGVLNTKEDWTKRVYFLNSRCIDAFCHLMDKLDHPSVVLSSTWRNGIARDGSTAVHVDDLIAALAPAGITCLDRTALSPDGMRSKEIDYYLRRHNVSDYLILDDDTTLFEKGRTTENLYVTDAGSGLTMSDVAKIIRMLRVL